MSDGKQSDPQVFEVHESGIGDGGDYSGWSDDLRAVPTGRRKARKPRPANYKASLGMNSLMDIVTIILVYLLKSFAGSPVSVPDPNIKLAISTASIVPERSTTILITPRRIVVNDKAVAQITDGKVDANDKRDGEQGYFINPVYDALVEAAEIEKQIAQYNPARVFKGIAIVLCDRRTPFRLLSEVMYSAGQAEYGNFRFAVIKKE